MCLPFSVCSRVPYLLFVWKYSYNWYYFVLIYIVAYFGQNQAKLIMSENLAGILILISFCLNPERSNKLPSFLQAYDQHLNMILGDVEETVTTIEIDEETYEEIYKVRTWFTFKKPFYGDKHNQLYCYSLLLTTWTRRSLGQIVMKVQRIIKGLVLYWWLQHARTLYIWACMYWSCFWCSVRIVFGQMLRRCCVNCSFVNVNFSFLLHSLPKGIFRCSLSEVTALCL